MNMPNVTHMMSFDVEEYFQAEAAARGGLRREDWSRHPMRLGPSVERILELLGQHGASATFFVLGWIAQNEPDVVKRIAAAGHEIASHGMNHQMITRLSPGQFRQDLLDSRNVLEDLALRPVVGYRAPTFSITHKTAWALDTLAECGFVYDSSVFPVRHDRYGVPDAPRWAHMAKGPGGGSILEIPPLTRRCLGANIPVGGGGYLRLLPVRILVSSLKNADRLGRPGMIYLHPWELDPGQPTLPMSALSRFRHRVNLSRTENKLARLLGEFRFSDVRAIQPDLLKTSESFVYGRGHQG